jgi:hypothetical protein
MKQTMFKAMLLALPLTLAVTASAAPPEDGDAAEPIPEPTEAEALEDDILLVIDLPIAADEARTAGVEEAEVTLALDVAILASLPASDMTEVLDEEAEQVKAKGKREAFGQWVKLQVAEGVRGKELAAKIKERKAELAKMSDEEKAELDAKIAAQGEKHREHRKKLHEKRKQLRDEGKQVVLAGKERHDKMVAEANERHAEAKAAWKAKGHHGKAGDKIDGRQDKLDEKQEAIDEKQEDAAGDPDKLDKLDKKEEQLEKREEKLEKKEEKLEDKQDKHEGHEDHGNHGKPGTPGKKGG